MLKCIEISGTPYELGVQWGQKARAQIRAGARFYRAHWNELTGISWQRTVGILKPAQTKTVQRLPKVFAELRGVAVGSGVPFEDLFVVNSMEALERARPKKEKCTSVLLRSRRSIILLHNEDWVARDGELLYMVRAHPRGEPSFLFLGEGAWIQTYGVNGMGLGFAADSLTARDARFDGIPQTFIGREVMRCRSVRQAVRKIVSFPRADGHAYALCSKEEGVILETTATRHALLKLRNQTHLAHTNFYQSDALRSFEVGARSYSRFRLARVNELLARRKIQNEKQAFDVLSDHTNYPQAVCLHEAEAAKDPTKEQTIASFIIDPAARALTIRHGNPCRGRTQRFKL